MANTIKIKRGTRANLDTLAGSSGLNQSELYHITDENNLALGTSTSAYVHVGGSPRVNSQASPSSITPDIASYDAYEITALAAALAINDPTGTPYERQSLFVRIVDNGTEQNISWGGDFRALRDIPLPIVTIPGKILDIELRYHSGLSVWACVNISISNQTLSNIEFIASGSFGGDSASTLNCDLTTVFTGGTALQEGDILLLSEVVAGTTNPSNDVLSSSGWTSLASVSGDDTLDVNLRVYRKIMSSSPDTDIDFTANIQDKRSVQVRGYRGVDQSTPIDVSVTTASGGNTLNVNPPSNTPASIGAVSVVFGGGSNYSNINSYTSPDLAEFLSSHYYDGSGQDAIAGSGHKFLDGTGAFDPAAWSASGDNTAWSWAAAHIILRTT